MCMTTPASQNIRPQRLNYRNGRFISGLTDLPLRTSAFLSISPLPERSPLVEEGATSTINNM